MVTGIQAVSCYMSLIGYTSRRPESFPTIDRAALMRDAHQIARRSRAHFATYAEALAYGLRAAWMSAKSRRQIQSCMDVRATEAYILM
jgi:hypothetical protein